MEGQGHLDPAEQLSRRFTVVEKKTSGLRLVLLRWKTHPRTDTLTRACSMLDTIATQERSLLEHVLEAFNARGTLSSNMVLPPAGKPRQLDLRVLY